MNGTELMYWITRLDHIYIACMAISIFIAIICFVYIIIYMLSFEDYNQTLHKKYGRKIFGLVILITPFITGTALTPTTKEACAIYVFGNILDYTKDNEKLKEIPDKVVNIAYNYVEELEQKSNNKNRQCQY